MHSPIRFAMIMAAVLSSADRAYFDAKMPALQLPPKPEGYGVHLSKAERRGRSWQELQTIRAERKAHA